MTVRSKPWTISRLSLEQ